MTGAIGERAAGVAGRWLLDLLLASARFDVIGREHHDDLLRAGRPFILVVWHGRLLPVAYWHRRRGIVTLVSRSSDGEHIARVLTAWGYHVVRGSSSRGATSALRQLVRHARTGASLAITPDGPRGPRQRMKLGAIAAAQLAGLPLLPVAAGADRAWWAGRWDRFLIPQPLTRIRLVYGAPRTVDRGIDDAALRAMARRLAIELDTLMRTADGE